VGIIVKQDCWMDSSREPTCYNLNMSATNLPTKTLILVLQSREETLAMVDAMRPEDRVHVSPEWLTAVRASESMDPWRHGFSIVHRETGRAVGTCGFKGPPADSIVEIAYGIDPEHQGKGYATEAAEALTSFAFAQNVRTARAHTFAEANASTRVLTKCGFHNVGPIIDPEDGPVWRWERHRDSPHELRAS
jgi:RimJ/RimL family protein N-acetyltransferase